MIEHIDPTPTFSRAVKHNGIIYFCGHVDGKKHDTIAGQTKALCEAYERMLKQHGSDKDHMLFVTIYISDLSLKDEMNEVWNAWLTPGCVPARVCVEAKIPEGFFLEMSVVAALVEEN